MHIHMEIQSFRIRLKAYKNLKKKVPQKVENYLYYTYKNYEFYFSSN